MKICPVDMRFDFELHPDGMVTKTFREMEGAELFDAEAGPVIKELTWEALLDSATEGVVGAIGGKIVSEILGPDDWERGVSNQLSTIISMLDEILEKVIQLQNYITNDRREAWRAISFAQITSNVFTLTDLIAGAKRTGTLSGNQLDVFKSTTTTLLENLQYIAIYNEHGQYQAIPLYAAIESGLLMLVAAFRILDIPIEETVLRFVNTFKTWEQVVNDLKQSQLPEITAEVDSLNNFPHRGALAVGGPGGHGYIPFAYSGNNDRTAVIIIIDGGMEKPFAYVRDEFLDYSLRDPYDPNRIPLFPKPYFFSSHVSPDGNAPGLSYAHQRSADLIRDLNARRTSAIDKLESLRRLQLVISGLSDAQTRFNVFLQPHA